jgi:O-antigen/teichoic acid export membrane protein
VRVAESQHVGTTTADVLKRRLVESIFFNYFGTIAAALGPLLALPIYVSVLGAAKWGMMSVVLTVVMLLIMMDGGLSQVLLREFALRARQYGHHSSQLRALWKSCRALYCILAVVSGSILAVSSTWIASHWLNLGPEIDHDEATHILVLSGLLVAIQLFAALPRSLLLALDLYRPLNISIALAHIFRFGGGVLVVWSTRSLQWLLLWYLTVTLSEGAFRFALVRRSIDVRGDRERASWSEIKRLGPGGAAMSLAVVLSGLATQTDKLILSRMVAVDQVGIYAIASNVALGLLSLTYPLVQAVFPSLLSIHEDRRRTRKIFLRWLIVATMCAALVMALYVKLGEAVLNLWLRNGDIASAVYPILFVLLIGTLLNVIYQVGYVGWMLEANYRMPMIVSASSVALTLLVAPTLVRHYGIAGAAAGWLLINALGLLFSLSWFRKIV